MGKTTIKNSMTWKLQGSLIGRTTIPMPNDYHEVLAIAQNGQNVVSAVYPREALSSTMAYMRLGGYYGNAGYMSATIGFDINGAHLENLSAIGVGEASATSTFKLYYR